MTQRKMCQCLIASVLGTTAKAWSQPPVEYQISGSADWTALCPSERPIQPSSSVFEIRTRGLHAGCHALQGPRCNARVGKNPSE